VIEPKILEILRGALELTEVSPEDTFGEIDADYSTDLLHVVHQIRMLVGRFDLLEGWMKQFRTSGEIAPIQVGQLVDAVVDDQTVNVSIAAYFGFSLPIKMAQRFADYPVQMDSYDVFMIVGTLRVMYPLAAVYSEEELRAFVASRHKIGMLTGEEIAMRVTTQTRLAIAAHLDQELQSAVT
jgi:hypothetical protein